MFYEDHQEDKIIPSIWQTEEKYTYFVDTTY
jgi:hypothetical protein